MPALEWIREPDGSETAREGGTIVGRILPRPDRVLAFALRPGGRGELRATHSTAEARAAIAEIRQAN